MAADSQRMLMVGIYLNGSDMTTNSKTNNILVDLSSEAKDGVASNLRWLERGFYPISRCWLQAER